ncbi:MAG: hypothetical protein IKE61_06400 [Coriobacteriales bacterium]|nr:hypothetical protein [Coriobacteriales bacterium]
MYEMKPMTERVKKIREMTRVVKPEISISRYKLLTEFYQNNPACTGIMRRAKAFKYICDNLDIDIHDHELFVGGHAPKYRSAAMYPESSADWMVTEIASGTIRDRYVDPYDISDEDIEYVKETIDYWDKNCNSAHVAEYTPEGFWNHMSNGCTVYSPLPCRSPVGHFVPGHYRVLKVGLQGILDEAQGYIDRYEAEGIRDNIDKYTFYRAIKIVCQGAINWSQRYADLALEKAAVCEDPERKAELELIAETCAHVPRYPARTYFEAIQSVWFYQLCCSLDAQLHGISFGRIDQYFNKYYERDLAAGLIDEEKGQELMDMFFLKVAEMNKPWGIGPTRTGPGYGTGQLATLGGVDRDGNDATNMCTYFALRSTERMIITQPSICVRIHENTPDELWDQIFHTISRVSGLPSFQNDKVIIPSLMSRGLTLEDARDYSCIGCVEPGGTGTEWTQCGGTGTETYFNIVAAFLHAINNGTNPSKLRSGKTPVQTGLPTGYLYEMTNIDQVMKAFSDQLEFFAEWHIGCTSAFQYVARDNMPVPIASAAIEGCMESGRDVMNMGAKYTSCGVSSIGTGNVADGLAAIDYLCFKTKRYTTREFYDAMMANWQTEQGQEIRAAIENDCPHFGNGDEEADKYGAFVFKKFADVFNGKKGYNGVYKAGTYPVTANVVFGSMTFATPDGRYEGDPLADGISGVQGRDVNGPTGVLKSISAYDCYDYSNGTLLNVKFSHGVIANEQTRPKVREFIETYFFDMDGMEIQVNFVDTATMKAAKEDPVTYRDLVVRIAGFSAFFIEQAEECQDDLIKRTELEM